MIVIRVSVYDDEATAVVTELPGAVLDTTRSGCSSPKKPTRVKAIVSELQVKAQPRRPSVAGQPQRRPPPKVSASQAPAPGITPGPGASSRVQTM